MKYFKNNRLIMQITSLNFVNRINSLPTQKHYQQKSVGFLNELKSDSVSFGNIYNNTLIKKQDCETCDRIIKNLYGEKAEFMPEHSRFQEVFPRFDVDIKGEYRTIGNGTLFLDSQNNLKYITIQEKDETGWCDIGEIKVLDTQGNIIKRLSKEQAKTLRQYRGNLASGLNSALRYNPRSPLFQDDIKIMDSMFSDNKIYSTLKKDTKIYRGFEVNEHNIDFFQNNFNVGKIFEEKGFLSTTKDKNRLNKYGNYFIEINVPAGTKYIDMPLLTSISEYYIHEDEILLNRNTKLFIKDYDPDTRTFLADIVEN